MTNPNEPYYESPEPVHEPATEPLSDSTVDHAVEPTPTGTAAGKKPKGSLAGGTWAALIVGILLLVLLLVFIIQNQQQAQVNLFAWTWHFPAGVAYLISAIIGAAIMALVGGWRMFELSRQIRHPERR